MSPHLSIVLISAALAAGAKLLFPRATPAILPGVPAALFLGLVLYSGEGPSLFGIALVLPLSLLGTAAGVVAIKLAKGSLPPFPP